eukprot:CAMPEP_0183373678 /NCGR_PEP_ID=MMETSP0164_2-20130417/112125_1 /TAXON_ID=221442 /ORGANISM="Coccolithus pelagicus ssp braarudi, Strain PLY182g" /LENGTH=109 /DNA_ID=CAMNT_0025550595 /DNA_START=695 /DNA_END=1020 /DNA_ORIENTATION=+
MSRPLAALPATQNRHQLLVDSFQEKLRTAAAIVGHRSARGRSLAQAAGVAAALFMEVYDQLIETAKARAARVHVFFFVARVDAPSHAALDDPVEQRSTVHVQHEAASRR